MPPRRLPHCTCSFLPHRSFASSSSTLSSPPLTLGQKLAARRAAATGSLPTSFDLPSDSSIALPTTPSLRKTTPLTKLVDTAIKTLTGKHIPPHHELAKAFKIRSEGPPRRLYARNSENGKLELMEEKDQASQPRSTGGNRRERGTAGKPMLDSPAIGKLRPQSNSNTAKATTTLPGQLQSQKAPTQQRTRKADYEVRVHFKEAALPPPLEPGQPSQRVYFHSPSALKQNSGKFDKLLPRWDILAARHQELLIWHYETQKRSAITERTRIKQAQEQVDSGKLTGSEADGPLDFDAALAEGQNSRFIWQALQEHERTRSQASNEPPAKESVSTEGSPSPASLSTELADILTEMISDVPSVSESASTAAPKLSSPALHLSYSSSIPDVTSRSPKATTTASPAPINDREPAWKMRLETMQVYTGLRLEHNRAYNTARVDEKAAKRLRKLEMIGESEQLEKDAAIPDVKVEGPLSKIKEIGTDLIAKYGLRLQTKGSSPSTDLPSTQPGIDEVMSGFPIRSAIRKAARERVQASSLSGAGAGAGASRGLEEGEIIASGASDQSAPPRKPNHDGFQHPLRSYYSTFVSSSSASPSPVLPPSPPVPIASLAHGLDRVLFNPGVHFVKDPRSGVYNFDPVLEKVPSIEEFDFSKLPDYITSSKDPILKELAKTEDKTFVGSTSSTVGTLCQIYFWLSRGKKPQIRMLSCPWRSEPNLYTYGQKIPVSIVLNEEGGRYSIDADKSYEAPVENILASYGHLMEKFLTTDKEEFATFLRDSPTPAASLADTPQAYHYVATDHMILRSQLDAHNKHLPNVSFDVKTRGTVAIRQDRLNHVQGSEYHIDRLRGPWLSFEREYYDLIRSAFLKYQFQARIGKMDGCIVAYHNTTQFFGFQYIPITEMDEALFGSTLEGEMVFKLCVNMMEKILLAAQECYPGRTLTLTLQAIDEIGAESLRVFVQPKDEGAGPEMVLLEFQGTNYVDGIPVGQVDIDKASKVRSKEVTWDFGYTVTKHDGVTTVATEERKTSEAGGQASRKGFKARTPPPLTLRSKDSIKHAFAKVRSDQMSFNKITLPFDVKLADLVKASQATSLASSESDSIDVISDLEKSADATSSNTNMSPAMAAALLARFPQVKGLEYQDTPSIKVRALRKLARDSQTQREEERIRIAEVEGGKVILRNYMETIVDGAKDEEIEEAQREAASH